MADENSSTEQRKTATRTTPTPKVEAPVAWVKEPGTGEVFAVSSQGELTNMRADGYVLTDAPSGMPKATGDVA